MDMAKLAAVGVGVLLLIRAADSLSGAAGNAAKAASEVAAAAGGAVADVVGAIGSLAGLPTPSQTLADPGQVRWIIDNVGHIEASQWGTAWAYMQAVAMHPGSGNSSPPPDDVVHALGIQTGASVPNTQGAVVDLITGGWQFNGGLMSGPTFDSVSKGAHTPFTL